MLFYECEQPVNTSQVLDKLVQDLSHIKISTIIPKEVEPEEFTPEEEKTLAISTTKDSADNVIPAEQSFVSSHFGHLLCVDIYS